MAAAARVSTLAATSLSFTWELLLLLRNLPTHLLETRPDPPLLKTKPEIKMASRAIRSLND
jgi:hypothetical protein